MENYLNLGIIIKTRGLKGVVKIKSTTYFASKRYKKGNKLFLVNEKENLKKEVTVNSFSNEGEFDYVSFNEITSLEEAEKYKGWFIQVDKSDLPPLKKGTYYFDDLVGLECFDEENNQFGKIIKVEDFTSQISFRILLNNQKTILIPFVEFYIKKINLEKKQVIVHVIPGLL